MTSLASWALGLLLSTANTIPCYDPNPGWGLGPGAIGMSCRAQGVGDAAKAARYYEQYSLNGNDFVDPATSAEQLHIYADNVLDVLEQMATDFYRERGLLENRTFTPEELQAWIYGVLAVAFQESYLTHFQLDRRTGDNENRLNILVGDGKCAKPYERRPDGRFFCPEFSVNADGMRLYGSQGMYQIMLSTHSSRSTNGFFDMVQNIQYGMGLYYLGWIKVIQGRHAGLDPCRALIFANGAIDYVKAAQASYSVYNGGPSKVCRWSADSPWRRNDEGYLFAVVNKPWYKFASDAATREFRKQVVTLPDGRLSRRFQFPFDLQCLRDAGADCMP